MMIGRNSHSSLLGLLTLVVVFLPEIYCIDWLTALEGHEVHHVEGMNGTVYAGTPEGLYILPKGKNVTDGDWEISFPSTPIEEIWQSSTVTFVLAGTSLYYRPADSDEEWKHLFPNKKIVAMDGNNEKLVFITPDETKEDEKTFFGRIFMIPLDQIGVDGAEPLQIGAFVASRVFVAENGDIFTYGDVHGPYGGTFGVTVNDGATWRNSVPGSSFKDAHIFSHNDILFLSSPLGGLLKSYDKGRTFSHVRVNSNSNGLPTSEITSLLVSHPVVFAATSNSGLYVSTGEGDTWDFHSSKGFRNFPSNKVFAVAFDPVLSTVIVGTADGVAVRPNATSIGKTQRENRGWFARTISGWGENKLVY